ncbi:hypothetical protein QTN47_13805 [Danxiaibacter flavus]|uniref:DoxX family protein n=1 Tax=Danxiaibacter flavus TaxID=3049108 RepID=A0ABV3ZFI6_9BACT|nr:hypothetical protein QNM32_13810 [Chitinophagaceae bacterium DXS]
MKPLFVLLITFGLTLLVTLLFGGLNVGLSGRVAMFVMLVFTAIGHFKFTEGMMMMLPPQVPAKKAIIYITGILEIVLGVMLVLKDYITATGFALIAFFLVLLPANIHAAARKVNYEKADYTGKGLSYLWIRIPMQILFIWWVYYFAICNTN